MPDESRSIPAPSFMETAFACPWCAAYAHQVWRGGAYRDLTTGGFGITPEIDLSYCSHCNEYAVWYSQQLVYPHSSTAPAPNPDLPEEIAADYREAGDVLALSPRSSAALLRLAIQKLCVFLGQPGKNLNDDIGALVKDGLPARVQKPLDVVRVIGNNAVHPGKIDLRDDVRTATSLFELVNLITEYMISAPKRIDAMYQGLPEEARAAIDKRDAS